MTTKALLVKLEAKPGKENEVASLLDYINAHVEPGCRVFPVRWLISPDS